MNINPEFLDERILGIIDSLIQLKKRKMNYLKIYSTEKLEAEASNRFLDTYLQAKLDLELLGKQKLKNMSIEEIQNGFEDINVILSNMNAFQEDSTGIYILHNFTKNKYYVGQGKNVNRRMLDHFTKSKSKNSILKDYKQGDLFEYKQIKLIESGFDNINELEKAYINYYNSIDKGYNSASGIGGIY